jgi:hypothetical protein
MFTRAIDTSYRNNGEFELIIFLLKIVKCITANKHMQKNRKSEKKHLNDQSSEEKSCPFLLIFGKLVKNGAFFVFTACSESL